MKFIRTTPELQACLSTLKDAPFVAVDTEFMRVNTFFPELCLIQLAYCEHVFVIDALSKDLDLTLLNSLLCAPETIKVFHACTQDIEALQHRLNITPSPIFDTQIAAMLCGFHEMAGYEKLVKKILKKKLDKSLQLTAWDKRPLKAKHLDYAANDVIYLQDLYRHFDQKLTMLERHGWARELFLPLESENELSLTLDRLWDKLVLKYDDAPYVRLLQTLLHFRESFARAHNFPREHVIQEQHMHTIACKPPKTMSGLREILQQHRRTKIPSGLIEACYEAIELPRFSLDESTQEIAKKKKFYKLKDSSSSVLSMLKLLLVHQAEAEQVAESLIANKQELLAFLTEKEVSFLQGFRYEIFGKHAEALLEGRLSLKLDGTNLKLTYDQ